MGNWNFQQSVVYIVQDPLTYSVCVSTLVHTSIGFFLNTYSWLIPPGFQNWRRKAIT